MTQRTLVAPHVQLTVFTTLQAALAEWPSEADCVLLDLGLPDAVDLTALDKLRAQVPDVPVVVLTGRVDDAIGPEALSRRTCGPRRTPGSSAGCCPRL